MKKIMLTSLEWLVRLILALVLSLLISCATLVSMELLLSVASQRAINITLNEFYGNYELVLLGAVLQYLLFVLPILGVLAVRRVAVSSFRMKRFIAYGVIIALSPWVVLLIVNTLSMSEYEFFRIGKEKHIENGSYTTAGILGIVTMFGELALSGAIAGFVFGAVIKAKSLGGSYSHGDKQHS